ncbi:MAG: cytochrome c553 [Gammaproteobacteria bacterium]
MKRANKLKCRPYFSDLFGRKSLWNWMMIRKSLVAAAVALAVSGAAFAEGNAEVGAKKGYTCLGCHGVEGYFNVYPTYRVPTLWGQHDAYLVAALQSYKKGDRTHPTMQSQASNLTDQDMADIAAYFSSHSQDPR